MKIHFAVAALAVHFLASSLSAGAQKAPVSKPSADLALTYSTLRANVPVGDCGCFWMNGGSAEFAVPVARGFSGVVEVSGERIHQLPGVPGIGLSLVSAMGGVRYTHPFHARYEPFAQGLFGQVHGFDSYFPGTTPSGAASAFAMATGIGLDMPLRKHLLLRLVQAEYQYMQLPNNAVNPANQQHDIRLSAGIVLRMTH
jgi:opacity protein-like surface antigen